jgi:RHS repeat-associated protein
VPAATSKAAPNGNTTTSGYDPLGRPTAKTTTGSGGVARAAYAWTHNRAGQILTESSTITGDPTNGTRTYGYDPLARLVTVTDATTTTYGWQHVPNRTSVATGANPAVTTSYDDANRPLTDSAGGTYGSDPEGRLTARPGQTLTYDTLGRLTTVKNAAGTVTLAAYTYDPLDRLRTVTRAGSTIRFRYVGLTTSGAQVVDHGTSAVLRHIGTDWTGGRLLDWTGAGSDLRHYGTNGHGDVTWTADGPGAVTATLRYSAFGETTSATGSSLPDFRYQGNWHDTTTDLAWIVTRWYAPSLGRFISEDTLLGEPREPDSRHLYAYAAGDPVGRWDPDGRIDIPVNVRQLAAGSWDLVSPRIRADYRYLAILVVLGIPTPHVRQYQVTTRIASSIRIDGFGTLLRVGTDFDLDTRQADRPEVFRVTRALRFTFADGRRLDFFPPSVGAGAQMPALGFFNDVVFKYDRRQGRLRSIAVETATTVKPFGLPQPHLPYHTIYRLVLRWP